MNSSNDKNIHLIICPVGVGKTEVIKETNALIAVPTHNLKVELSKRMNQQHAMTPADIKFESYDLNKRIQIYWALGLHSKASRIINEVANGTKELDIEDNDTNQARIYLDELDNCKKTKSTVITTHARSVNSEFPHDTIIYDEDPLNSFVQVHQIWLNELVELISLQTYFKKDAIIKSLITYFNDKEIGKVYLTDKFDYDRNELFEELVTKEKNYSNLFGFLDSEMFIIQKVGNNKLISYISKKSFPQDKKIIILSATASEYIYRQLYGDRLIVHRIGDVVQQGQVIQDTSRSCSRDGLKKYLKSTIKKIDALDIESVVTFKDSKKNFAKADEIAHFGNCSGYDHLKGKNIAVVGTPHFNNVQYLLLAKLMGLDWDEEEEKVTMQEVIYGGFQFKFNTFGHEGLRQIQLSMIEGDLIQAVGRARTIRTDAIVHVMSYLPLRLTTSFV
jgi:hypothetical protein